MAYIETKDATGRTAQVIVEPMRGAILKIIREDRGGRKTTLSVALTPEECRLLAADFGSGGSWL